MCPAFCLSFLEGVEPLVVFGLASSRWCSVCPRRDLIMKVLAWAAFHGFSVRILYAPKCCWMQRSAKYLLITIAYVPTSCKVQQYSGTQVAYLELNWSRVHRKFQARCTEHPQGRSGWCQLVFKLSTPQPWTCGSTPTQRSFPFDSRLGLSETAKKFASTSSGRAFTRRQA